MSNGVFATLEELIDLRYYAQKIKPHRSSAFKEGIHSSRLRGRGIDFAEVRNYQAGDDIRHMDWRVTARTGRPHIKVYHQERERPVVIIVDFNSTMFFGTKVAFKSVIAARLAALFAWASAQHGDRVGAMLYSFGQHLELIPRPRIRGVLPILSALAKYTQSQAISFSNQTFFTESFKRLQHMVKPGTILFMLSDFYHFNEEEKKCWQNLGNHYELFTYHIYDPLELIPPPPGTYAISNGKDNLVLDTGQEKIYRLYKEESEKKFKAIKNFFLEMQIPYYQVATNADLIQIVSRYFKRRPYDL